MTLINQRRSCRHARFLLGRRAESILRYGGHFLTKSRRYSVTFGQLRRARAEHRRLERYGDDDGVRDPWGRPLDDTIVQVVNDWTYAGRGYAPRTLGAQLALASADMARGRAHQHGTANADLPSSAA
jgi:Replication initiator protein, pSAM2